MKDGKWLPLLLLNTGHTCRCFVTPKKGDIWSHRRARASGIQTDSFFSQNFTSSSLDPLALSYRIDDLTIVGFGVHVKVTLLVLRSKKSIYIHADEMSRTFLSDVYRVNNPASSPWHPTHCPIPSTFSSSILTFKTAATNEDLVLAPYQEYVVQEILKRSTHKGLNSLLCKDIKVDKTHPNVAWLGKTMVWRDKIGAFRKEIEDQIARLSPLSHVVLPLGAGKTVVGAMALRHLKNTYPDKPVYLVCPPVVIASWTTHLKTWAGFTKILGCHGTSKPTRADLDSLDNDVVIIPNSILNRRDVVRTGPSFSGIWIFDECHGPSYLYSWINHHLSRDAIVIGMTATANNSFTEANNWTSVTYPHRVTPSHLYKSDIGLSSLLTIRPETCYRDTKEPMISYPELEHEKIEVKPTRQDSLRLEEFARAISSLDFSNRVFYRIWAQRLMRFFSADPKIPIKSVQPSIASSSTGFAKLQTPTRVEPPTSTTSCAICLSEPSSTVKLGCNHYFCFDCIRQWYEGPRSAGKNCVTCRQPITKFSLVEGGEEVEEVTGGTPSELVSKLGYIAKANWLKTFLETTEEGTPLVVMTRYAVTVKTLVSFLRTHGFSTVGTSASQSSKGRIKAIDDWKQGKADVLVAHYQVAGTGVSLTRASNLVIYDYLPKDQCEQAIGRIRRFGQTASTVKVKTLYGTFEDRHWSEDMLMQLLGC